jgi:hypothetical protein
VLYARAPAFLSSGVAASSYRLGRCRNQSEKKDGIQLCVAPPAWLFHRFWPGARRKTHYRRSAVRFSSDGLITENELQPQIHFAVYSPMVRLASGLASKRNTSALVAKDHVIRRRWELKARSPLRRYTLVLNVSSGLPIYGLADLRPRHCSGTSRSETGRS